MERQCAKFSNSRALRANALADSRGFCRGLFLLGVAVGVLVAAGARGQVVPGAPQSAPPETSATTLTGPPDPGTAAEQAQIILASLAAQDMEVRRTGVRALATFEAPWREEQLLLLLSDPDERIRAEAAEALAARPSGTLPRKYLDLLASSEPSRFAALSDVAFRLTPQLEKPALAILDDADQPSGRRQAAAHALGLMHSTLATSSLFREAQGRDRALAVASAHALSASGDPAAYPLCRELLKRPVPEIQYAAIEALGRWGGPEAIAALIEGVRLTRRGNTSASALGMRLLGGMGDWSAIDVLIEGLGGTGTLRAAAAEALTALTGQNYGDSLAQWQAWNQARLAGKPSPRAMGEGVPFEIEPWAETNPKDARQNTGAQEKPGLFRRLFR